jgi:hypothetical protein
MQANGSFEPAIENFFCRNLHPKKFEVEKGRAETQIGTGTPAM